MARRLTTGMPSGHFPWRAATLGTLAFLVVAGVILVVVAFATNLFSGASQTRFETTAPTVQPEQQVVTESEIQEPLVPEEQEPSSGDAALATIPIVQGGEWELFRGPKGALIVDPENPSTLYVVESLAGIPWVGPYDPAKHKPGDFWGTARAEIWKSEDDGESWQSLGIRSRTVVVHETQPEVSGYTNLRVAEESGPTVPENRIQRLNSDELETYYRELGEKMGLQELALADAQGDSQVLFAHALAREKGEEFPMTFIFFFSLDGGKTPIGVEIPQGLESHNGAPLGGFLKGDEINLLLFDNSNAEIWRYRISLAELREQGLVR